MEGLGLTKSFDARRLVSAILKSMRLHQWVKNLLVFVPLALIAPHANLANARTFGLGFVLFGLLASGTYLLNDLADVESDRRHPHKRRRPIPASDLSVAAAAIASFALIGGAMAGAVLLDRAFAAVLLAYLLLTIAYSFVLKRIPLIDVLTVAALFTLRIVAGMTLVGEPISEWMLIFSIFFFFSLALMKREAEFGVMDQAGTKVMHGRGYAIDDRLLVTCFGISSGMASLVVFALFVSAMVDDPAARYSAPVLLWGAMPVMSYWIMRMWLLTGRGLMTDDPILYAVRDRASLILGALLAGVVLAAQFLKL